ncbi:MAG TPA: DNA repair protein RecN [Oscillospiraceae bacterium]|nr:DNA repair protein RecN [Oscillospiraceae bacterium]
MLSEIYIENLAVIQKAIIPIGSNLNVFTGETGAGKSILINGINAVLGQRITKDIVRTGAEKAIITALFKNIPKPAKDKLDEFGISYEDDEIAVSREIFADGGSVARINGRTSTVAVLKELGEVLINIHGQHDNQILLSPEKHLEILDKFGGLEVMLADYRDSFKRLQEIAKKINKLSANEAEKAQKIEMLSYKIEEIGALEIDEEQDALVEEEFLAAENSDRISKALAFSRLLIEGDENTSGTVEQIENAISELLPYSEILPKVSQIISRLENAKIELEDIAGELYSLGDKIDLDSERFDYLSRRREELIKIKKKYGPELKDVINTYQAAVEELQGLQNSSVEIEELKKEKKALLDEVTEKAKKLSKARGNAAKTFIEQVASELSFLDMPNVKLEVAHQKGKLTLNGMDGIEFLISANLGEPPKPISKIASGGELSRIMLALKNVIADKDDIPTLIFDEIDTGVSGRAAQKIGIKLAQIAKIRQVLCVTHLAQIAAMADNHLLIEKNAIEGRTVTNVTKLDFEGRKREIARIMGGDNISPLMLQSAEQMLKSRDDMEILHK